MDTGRLESVETAGLLFGAIRTAASTRHRATRVVVAQVARQSDSGIFLCRNVLPSIVGRMPARMRRMVQDGFRVSPRVFTLSPTGDGAAWRTMRLAGIDGIRTLPYHRHALTQRDGIFNDGSLSP